MRLALATPARLRLALALCGALLALDLISFAFGQAPLATLGRAAAGTWGTAYGTGQVLFKATPLLLTGLAVHVALRAGLFNIGTEGQLALASLGGAWVATQLGTLPSALALPATLGAAMLIGGAYAAVSGWMRARLGVHEIISGIMLNRSADVLLPWVLVTGLGAADLRTADVAAGARLPALERYVEAFGGSAVSVAFPLAVTVTIATYVWLGRSRAGREMAWIGRGAEACAAQGIDVPRRRVQAMVLSGALCSLAMAGTVLGYKGYYELGLGCGTGLSGIAVAMVGRSGPIGLTAAALLLGTLAQAGLAINAEVPREAMGVLEALVILLVAAATHRGERGRLASPPDRDARADGPRPAPATEPS